jgi:hypothetical protein
MVVEVVDNASGIVYASAPLLIAPVGRPGMVRDIHKLLLSLFAEGSPSLEDDAQHGRRELLAAEGVESFLEDLGVLMQAGARLHADVTGGGIMGIDLSDEAATLPLNYSLQLQDRLVENPVVRQHLADVACTLLACCITFSLPAVMDYVLDAACSSMNLNLCPPRELISASSGLEYNNEVAVETLEAWLKSLEVGLVAKDMLASW